MQFTLTEVCEWTRVSRRNVRFYIQEGLVDRPNGVGRGAWYSGKHMSQLMIIKYWKDEGLSLQRIRDLLQAKDSKSLPPPRENTGGIEVWSHIHVKDGVELHIQPGKAGLSPEQLRMLQGQLLQALDDIQDKE
jgi:DNA-binding transcriptional MerR regulator